MKQRRLRPAARQRSIRGRCVLAPVSIPTQSATNLILGRDTDGRHLRTAVPIICAKTTHRTHPGRCWSRAGPRQRTGDLSLIFSVTGVAREARTRSPLKVGMRHGCTIGTPLADIEPRRHPAPCGRWRLRKRLRSATATAAARHDKELETEGVFMNTRTKLAIAVSAAMWMVPMTQAVAGFDVSAGDWKLDFSGNVNAFYVG